jgi:hypothetical protein
VAVGGVVYVCAVHVAGLVVDRGCAYVAVVPSCRVVSRLRAIWLLHYVPAAEEAVSLHTDHSKPKSFL